MGPSRSDPDRQVGVFPPGLLHKLASARSAELEKFRWIVGDWAYQNSVPETRVSPAYTDAGRLSFALCENEGWVCAIAPDGRQTPQITFDPFSRQWIYVLTRGSYGILRSSEGWRDDQIVFTGFMTMLGINCEWRMTWTKAGEDRFGFVNEELADGSWTYIDEWRFVRISG